MIARAEGQKSLANFSAPQALRYGREASRACCKSGESEGAGSVLTVGEAIGAGRNVEREANHAREDMP